MASYNENLGSVDGDSNGATREYAVKSGDTVTVGDLVYLTAGRVTSASIAGVRLLGQVVGVKTNDLVTPGYKTTATGDAGGTVKVLVTVSEDDRYLLKNDNLVTTFAATHVGTYFDLIGNTGAQLVDTSTTSTTGQLLCLAYNPGIRGTDATYGIFQISEHQNSI